MSREPFHIDIPDATLEDLRVRLFATRLSPRDDEATWEAGTSPLYLRQLLEHWRTAFDWREHERELNTFCQYRTTIRGTNIHFVHERGRGDSPMPIVLTHGWPDSFVRFKKLIPMLTDPQLHGGDLSDAFDVIVPSLPGFAFSDPIDRRGATFEIGDLWHELMVDELGYSRYAAHGGDWGATVTEHLARSHAANVLGIHLTDVPFWHAFQKPSDPTPAEEAFLAGQERFPFTEGAYAMIQSTRPQTLADALNDSPAGLAAWIVEKFEGWSDCNGDIESRFTKDELLVNVMIYWATGTIASSFQPYYDFAHASVARWILEKAKEWVSSAKVPAAFALFPKDLSQPPREWAERFFDVQRWTEMPRGGHFAAMEEPELLAEDIRAFFRPLR